MSRIARIVAVGFPHHITQRGNFQQDVFQDSGDRKRYLSWLEEYSNKYGLSILAYCLMLNHVHVLGIPSWEDSLAKTFNATHMRYSQYFNRKKQRTGHLWQNRFYSCVLDEPHLIAASRYVEQNPVRANLVEKPWEWKWSSARSHVNQGSSLIKLDDLFKYINIQEDPGSWKEFIDVRLDDKALDEIRKHTLVGRPLGEKSFIEKLEKKLGRRIHPLPIGKQPIG